MVNQSHRLGEHLGHLAVVTFSGAHGVGKSTIVADLKARLEASNVRCVLIPSVSTKWFKDCQEACRQAQREVPVTYDDINRLGYRAQMQREMPRILANMVVEAVTKVAANGDGGVVIVDRWFGDIAAYTALEIDGPAAVEVQAQAKDACIRLISALSRIAQGYYGPLTLTHIFVPVSSCQHALQRGVTAEKAHRGTQPVDQWEAAYASVNEYTDPHRTIDLTAADRAGRVAEVLAAFR